MLQGIIGFGRTQQALQRLKTKQQIAVVIHNCFGTVFTIRVGTVHLGNHILRTMNVKRRYFHPRIKALHKQRAVILIIDFFRTAVHFNIPVEVEHLLIIKLIIIKNRQALVPPVFGVFILQIEVKVKTVKNRTGNFVNLRQRIITCNLSPFHHVIIISERGIQRQINPGRILGIRCLFFAAAQIFQLIDKSFKDNHIPAMGHRYSTIPTPAA